MRVKKFPLFDVFLNDGWEWWSRVLIRDGTAKVVAGNPLPAVRLKTVLDTAKA